MEIAGILTFIGIFVSIVLILISIAYYGIREPSYDEAVVVESKKKSKKEAAKESNNKKQAKHTLVGSSNGGGGGGGGGGGDTKKRAVSADTHAKTKKVVKEESRVEAAEEEPIVIIPDPFTLQVNSRFAGATRNSQAAQPKASHQAVKAVKQHQENKEDSALTASTENLKTVATTSVRAEAPTVQSTMEKVKPKATVKPNQKPSEHVGASVLPPPKILVDKEMKVVKAVNTGASLSKSSENISISPVESMASQYKAQLKTMENNEATLNAKIKEMTAELSEKSKQILALNGANTTLKTEITRFEREASFFVLILNTV